MTDLLSSFAGALGSALLLIVGGLVLLGIPLALFEGLFGRSPPPGRGSRPTDRAGHELYERRLRDSHRR